MNKRKRLVIFGLIAIFFASVVIAQHANQMKTAYVLRGSLVPPNCQAYSNPVETDSGFAPLTPGEVSGSFHIDAGNVYCGIVKDKCDPANPSILWESVLGSSLTPQYDDYSGVISVDCGTYFQDGVCYTSLSNKGFCGPAGPDLEIAQVTLTSGNPIPSIQIDILNTGNAASLPTMIRARMTPTAASSGAVLLGPEVQYAVISAIQPGSYESVNIAFSRNGYGSGTDVLFETLSDPTNIIQETDEFNNAKDLAITI